MHHLGGVGGLPMHLDRSSALASKGMQPREGAARWLWEGADRRAKRDAEHLSSTAWGGSCVHAVSCARVCRGKGLFSGVAPATLQERMAPWLRLVPQMASAPPPSARPAAPLLPKSGRSPAPRGVSRAAGARQNGQQQRRGAPRREWGPPPRPGRGRMTGGVETAGRQLATARRSKSRAGQGGRGDGGTRAA